MRRIFASLLTAAILLVAAYTFSPKMLEQLGPGPSGVLPPDVEGVAVPSENLNGQQTEDPKATARRLFSAFEKDFYDYDCVGYRDTKTLEHIIELNPTLAEAYVCLAGVYWSVDQNKTIDTCKWLETRYPQHPQTYYCLGRFRVGSAPESKAARKDYFRKAVEADPENAKFRRVLATHLRLDVNPFDIDSHQLDEAILHFRVALTLDPPTEVNRMAIEDLISARGLEFLGRYDEAAEMMEMLLESLGRKSMESNEFCQNTHYFDSIHYAHRKRFQIDLWKIQRNCLLHEDAARAAVFQSEGKTEEAIAAWEAQHEKNPYHAGVYENLPKLYVATGQPDKARALIERYFEIDDVTEDRCDMRTKLLRQEYESLVPALFAQLKQECSAPTP